MINDLMDNFENDLYYQHNSSVGNELDSDMIFSSIQYLISKVIKHDF